MAGKSIRQLQGDQTRERIVAAATRLFARKGFYGTSIAALARAAGLTKGALYHHFTGKDAIFFAVVESVRRLWDRGVARSVAQGPDAPSRLGLLLDHHARLLGENEMLCLVMSNLMLEMTDANPDYAAVLQQVYEDLTAFIERILRDGQAAGAIRPDIDARLSATAVAGMLKGIGCDLPLARMGSGRLDIAAALKRMLLDGVRARAS